MHKKMQSVQIHFRFVEFRLILEEQDQTGFYQCPLLLLQFKDLLLGLQFICSNLLSSENLSPHVH